MGDSLLQVENLCVEFATDAGWARVVDRLNFSLDVGETLGLVGESGSGKSVTALSILRLLKMPPARIADGRVVFEGTDIFALKPADLRRIRGREIAMIFQEPMSSLNPAYTVGEQIAEAVRWHWGWARKRAWARAVEVLELVQIPTASRRASDYPHAFSGGMRQRVMIAMAIACNPKLLLADEPTTALDVTVQAEILTLLRELRNQFGMAMIFVSHDLGVIGEIADRAMVMYAGQIVEQARLESVFVTPRHPYTEGLIQSMPILGSGRDRFSSISGRVPLPWEMPAGCRFHPRCPYATDPECTTKEVELVALGDHVTRCVRSHELQLNGVGSTNE